ncbi:MAG: FemAB family PEP-CTERM system-associated protein [Steroidobacteraceae bacterium]|nr:FemAB family PEP-CTERM system-associated protein [Steroidobacteraceae bacterium]
MSGSTGSESRARDPEVLLLAPDLESAWDAFVKSHPEGTFFHLAGWREVLRRAFGHRTHYLVALAGDEVRGVLPLAEVKSLFFGHSLVSTPFCVYGGIVAADETAKAALEARACALARELGVDHLEMRNRRRQHPDWPVKDLYVTFRKAIDADSEKNLLAIPRKQRAMVRKGIQKGLRSEIDARPDRHYAMYSESLRNLGTPVFSKRYLEILQDVFGEDCEILTVIHEAAPVAGGLSFFFRGEVVAYYGGGSPAAGSGSGKEFMDWSVMERAREGGRRLFDYGRSKRGTGSFDFKTYWGFEPEPLYYEYFLVKRREMPNLSPTNPKYEAMIRIWRKLPIALTRLLGPPVAKHLG